MEANVYFNNHANKQIAALMNYPTNSRTISVFPFSNANLMSEPNSTYSSLYINGYNFIEKFFQILSNTKPFDPDFKRVLDDNFFDLLA